jgi:hypothetical protein
MKDIVAEAVTFNLYYAGVASTERSDAPQEVALPPVDETTPEFRDLHFEGLVCAGAKQAIYINGLPELPLKDVDFVNCVFTAKKGVEMYNTDHVTFEDVVVNGKQL